MWYQKHKQEKKKTDKLDFIKIKHLCIKGHYQQSERQHMELGKIFANHLPDKGLISKLYTELLQLNKNKQLNLKMGKRLR